MSQQLSLTPETVEFTVQSDSVSDPRRLRDGIFVLENFSRPVPTIDPLQNARQERPEHWVVTASTQELLGATPRFSVRPGKILAPSSLRPYLSPTESFRAGHAELARKITKDAPDISTATARLVSSVHKSVVANGVEFSRLPASERVRAGRASAGYFLTLSRAIGIPSRTVAGLLWLENALVWHAWNLVWIGENMWASVDPGMDAGGRDAGVVDAARIILAEGEPRASERVLRALETAHVRSLK